MSMSLTEKCLFVWATQNLLKYETFAFCRHGVAGRVIQIVGFCGFVDPIL